MMPSIIIPAKNAERTIGQLLNSLLMQNYRPIEIIVVEGGSTDNTRQIVEHLSKSDNSDSITLRLLSEEEFPGDRGTSHARNIGIKESSGEYLIFLDADFVLLDRTNIEATLSALKTHSAVSAKVEPLIDTWIEEQCALDTFVKRERTYVHCYFAIHRDSLNGSCFDEKLAFGEDYDLFKRCSIKPVLIEVTLGRHFASSLTEYFNEIRWYGKTSMPFVSKDNSYLKMVLQTFAIYVFPLLLLFSSVLALVFNYMPVFVLALLSFLVLGLIQLWLSPRKTISRFFYLSFVKPIFKLCFFAFGIAENLGHRLRNV